MNKAWITFSQPSAGRLAQQLREAGFATLVEPATAIQYLSWSPPAAPPDRLIFLSQHAAFRFLQFSDSLLTMAARCESVLAIGDRSAQILRQSGLKVSVPRTEQSEGLLAMPELVPADEGGLLRPTDRVWQMGGKGGRDTIARALANKCCLQRCDVYERQGIDLNHVDVSNVGAILVGSIHGLEHAVAHWRVCGREPTVTVIGPSQRVAARAEQLGFSRSFDAGGSDGKAKVRALQRAKA